MSDGRDALSPISFTFEYEGHGWAHACISNGTDTYSMVPSYVAGDPLGLLPQAVVEILRHGGDDTGCEWFMSRRWIAGPSIEKAKGCASPFAATEAAFPIPVYGHLPGSGPQKPAS